MNRLTVLTPSDDQSGTHTIQLIATIAENRIAQTFEIRVSERTLLAELEIDVSVGGALVLGETDTALDGMTLQVPPASGETGTEWLSIYEERGELAAIPSGFTALGPAFQVHWEGSQPVQVHHSTEALGSDATVFLSSQLRDALHDESGNVDELVYVPGPLAMEVSGVVANEVAQLRWTQCEQLLTRESETGIATYCADATSPNPTQVQAYLETILGYLDDALSWMDERGCSTSHRVPIHVIDLPNGIRGRVQGDQAPVYLSRSYVDAGLGGHPDVEPLNIAGTVAHELVHYLQKEIVGVQIYYARNADHERWWVEGTATYEAGRITSTGNWARYRQPWSPLLADIGLWFPTSLPPNLSQIYYKHASFYSAVDAQTATNVCQLFRTRAANPNDVGAYESHAQWLGGADHFDRLFTLYAASYNVVRSGDLLRHVDDMELADASYARSSYVTAHYRFTGDPTEIVHEGNMSGAQTVRIELDDSLGAPGESAHYRIAIDEPADDFWFVVHDFETGELLTEGYPSVPERTIELVPGQHLAVTVAHRQRARIDRSGNDEQRYVLRFEDAGCSEYTCGSCLETTGCAWCPTDYTVLGLGGTCVPEDEGMCPAPLVEDAAMCEPPPFETPECGFFWPHFERPWDQCFTCFTEGCAWTGGAYDGTCVPVEDVEDRFDDLCSTLSTEASCNSDLVDGVVTDCEWCGGDFCRTAGRCAEGPAETSGLDVYQVCSDPCTTQSYSEQLCAEADGWIPGGCDWCGVLCMQRGACEYEDLYTVTE